MWKAIISLLRLAWEVLTARRESAGSSRSQNPTSEHPNDARQQHPVPAARPSAAREDPRVTARREAQAAARLVQLACHECQERLEENEPDEVFAERTRSRLEDRARRLASAGRAMTRVDDPELAAACEDCAARVFDALDYLDNVADEPSEDSVEEITQRFHDLGHDSDDLAERLSEPVSASIP
jgi:hypothetical protein